MWLSLISLLALILGFVLGMWVSVFITPVEVNGEKTISDLLSLTFTILGGGAGFVATGFALYVYQQWLVQQRNSTIYNVKVKLLKHIYSMTVYAENMLLARANPKTMKVNEHRVNLVSSISDMSVEVDILKTLDVKLEPLTQELMKLNHISAKVLNMRVFPELDSVDKIYISSFNEWRDEFSYGFFDRIQYEVVGNTAIRCYQLKDINKNIEQLAEELKDKLKSGL